MEIPERWRKTNLASMSNSEIEEMIADMRKADRSVNLPIPFLPETIHKISAMFHCKRCGRCCIGGAEGVFLNQLDIKRLSKGMEMSEKQFVDEFTFISDGRHFLPFPCPFYDAKSSLCIVYQFRPDKCKLFPFYPSSNITITQDTNPSANKVSAISISVRCPEGRDIAMRLLKSYRDSNKR